MFCGEICKLLPSPSWYPPSSLFFLFSAFCPHCKRPYSRPSNDPVQCADWAHFTTFFNLSFSPPPTEGMFSLFPSPFPSVFLVSTRRLLSMMRHFTAEIPTPLNLFFSQWVGCPMKLFFQSVCLFLQPGPLLCVWWDFKAQNRIAGIPPAPCVLLLNTFSRRIRRSLSWDLEFCWCLPLFPPDSVGLSHLPLLCVRFKIYHSENTVLNPRLGDGALIQFFLKTFIPPSFPLFLLSFNSIQGPRRDFQTRWLFLRNLFFSSPSFLYYPLLAFYSLVHFFPRTELSLKRHWLCWWHFWQAPQHRPP